MRINAFYLIPFSLLMLLLTSCDPDDPEIINEEELITTLNLTLVPEDGGDPVVFTFVDLDGDGGDAPMISSSPLSVSTTYNASIELLNEQESPAEDITEEVMEEAEEHQFFYVQDSEAFTIAYTDSDANNNPIGITTQMVTADEPTDGSLLVILKHEPDKNAAGVSGGDPANAGGETDIEVTFTINVQ